MGIVELSVTVQRLIFLEGKSMCRTIYCHHPLEVFLLQQFVRALSPAQNSRTKSSFCDNPGLPEAFSATYY
jgi:hypothetical protein